VQRDYVPSFVFSDRQPRRERTDQQHAVRPFEKHNTSQDIVASLTKLRGSHTLKTGFFMNRAVKEQSSRAAANGLVSFTNDASNPFDTGFRMRMPRSASTSRIRRRPPGSRGISFITTSSGTRRTTGG